ncbi:MAG: hypothetical protein ACR2N5_02305 [Solirubrobacterales bacterium]
MGELQHYRGRLRGAVASSAAPYGFTLVIWTSGAITADVRGFPSSLHALMLAAGAITAFAVVGLLAFRDPEHVLATPKEPAVELWGAFHLPVVGAAIALAALIAHTVQNPVVAWALVGFGATATYLLVIALQYLLAERRADRRKLNLPSPSEVAEEVAEGVAREAERATGHRPAD